MAITFVAAGVQDDLKIYAPAGLAAGDIIIAGVATRPPATGIGVTGFTKIAQVEHPSGTNGSIALLWRIADPDTDPAYWDIGLGSVAQSVGFGWAYRGVSNTDPIADFTTNHDSDATIEWLSVDVPADAAMIVGVAEAVGGLSGEPGAPTGTTLRWPAISGPVGSAKGMGWEKALNAGASGDFSTTVPGGNPWASILAALRPAFSIHPPPLFIPFKDRLTYVKLDADGHPDISTVDRAIAEDSDNLRTIERWAAAFMGMTSSAARCELFIPHKATPTATSSLDNFLAIERWAAKVSGGECGCSCGTTRAPERCQLHIPYKDCLTDLEITSDGTMLPQRLAVAATREFDCYKAIERWANRWAVGDCGCVC